MKLLFSLSIAGVLFAGYLSSVRFFTDTCAFNEPCPYFLGYPACYFGFAMYLLMTLVIALYYFGILTKQRALTKVVVISGAGILFAGFFTLKEMPQLFVNGMSAYLLGLPTCAYGLLVYTAIMVLAVRALMQERRSV